MSPTRLHIGEVAHLLRITPKAIRHYHAMGLLAEPTRDENGYRLYDVTALRRLQQIGRLQALGLSLRQIRFILEADEPDALLADVLQHRHASIGQTIAQLQAQQASIEALLAQPITLETLPNEVQPPHSSARIMATAMRPISEGLADIVTATEQAVLDQIDHYVWAEGYDAFWHAVGRHIAASLRQHEHTFILWMERYLALAKMAPDDIQGRAWLEALRHSPERALLAGMWCLPSLPHLPAQEQNQVLRLFPLLLLEQSTPLQREFLMLVRG